MKNALVLVGMLALNVASVQAQQQTPGQIVKFDPILNDADSVITEDDNGNIGVGTQMPIARLDVARGNVNLEDSTAAGGNLLKAGVLFLHNSGPNNTFLGKNAGNLTTSGNTNTGVGVNSLSANVSGYGNAAIGASALQSNDSGSSNVAMGYFALRANTTGFGNTAMGNEALSFNRTGIFNTAAGRLALGESNGSANVAIGTGALHYLQFGDDNIAIGTDAGYILPNGYTNIYIGNPASEFPESNTIRIGRAIGHNRFFAAGVSGVPVGGAPVFVNSLGQLGVQGSSRRFKEEIREMDETTNRLRQLRPVSFYYKRNKPYEGKGRRQVQYGLIAEEVAAVYPELVEYSDKGSRSRCVITCWRRCC